MKTLIRFLMRWMPAARPVVVDVGKEFGPRLEWAQVLAAFRHRKNDPLFQAVGQLLACQRELCVQAVADKSNLVSDQTRYEAGAAGCAADVMALLVALEQGQCADRQIQAYFGAETIKPKES